MSSKIRGNLVTAVAWNSSNTSERLVMVCCAIAITSTRVNTESEHRDPLYKFPSFDSLFSNTAPILIGTSRGVIFETELDSGEDRIFNTGLESSFRQGRKFYV